MTDKEIEEAEKQKKILQMLKEKLFLELDKGTLSIKQYSGQVADYTILFLDSEEEYQLLREWLDK